MGVRLFHHSQKALRTRAADCPHDRIFLIMDELTHEHEDKRRLVAWKCTLKADGLDHPAFKTVLPLTSEGILRGALTVGDNKSTPTAEFAEDDCLYEEITLDALRATVKFVLEGLRPKPAPMPEDRCHRVGETLFRRAIRDAYDRAWMDHFAGRSRCDEHLRALEERYPLLAKVKDK